MGTAAYMSPEQAVGMLLLVTAIALGVVFMIKTPVETLVIEVNEPDAEVQVDGGKVTIQSPSEEPIEIQVDEGRHTLKVTKGGFETFTEEFAIKSGGRETVRVQLKPMDGTASAENEERVTLRGEPPNTATPATSTTPPESRNFALEFDGEYGKPNYVEIPTLVGEANKPFTVEAIIRSYEERKCAVVAQERGAGINAHPAWEYHWAFHSLNVEPSLTRRATTRLQPNQTIHLAGVCQSGSLRLYVNGVFANTGLTRGTDGEQSRPQQGTALGANWHPAAKDGSRPQNSCFHGIIDEVRFSSIARYTEDFTPQKRFEPDEHTLALYHFDEGQGDVLKDSSGNGHHGEIVGARWVRVDDELRVLEEGEDTKETNYTWPEDQPDPAIAPFTADEAKQHQEEWAEHLGVTVEFENSIGMKMVLIPPGEFMMGSSEKEIEAILKWASPWIQAS